MTIAGCDPIQFQYENQALGATDTNNQSGSYYALSVTVGNRSTNVQFTLGVAEFKILVITV